MSPLEPDLVLELLGVVALGFSVLAVGVVRMVDAMLHDAPEPTPDAAGTSQPGAEDVTIASQKQHGCTHSCRCFQNIEGLSSQLLNSPDNG